MEPLTRRRKKDGVLYVRPDAIEQEIAAAVDRPLSSLLASTSPASGGCLVYFARRYRTPALINALLERAARIVRRHTGHIPVHRRADIQEWVRDELLARVMAGTDVLDIYEAQFGLGVRSLTADAIRRFVQQDRIETSAETLASGDDDIIAADALDRQLFKASGPQTTEAEVKVELARVRALLTDKEFKAMYAHHVLGLKIESIDKTEPTVATLMGVSDRQVRTYMASAIKKATESNL